jgi:uncharacterized SAM-binding protein YcdF (DUF218 family)
VRRLARIVLVAAMVASVVAIGVTLSVRALGRWLVIDDPVARGAAIVVLGGGFPFRAIEAASLYHAGWAPEVWLPRPGDPAREAVLARLGFEAPGEHVSSVAVLTRRGVPAAAIRVLPGVAQSTVAELEVVAEELGRRGGDSVILVTSKPHTRRVRATWRTVVDRGARAIVRYPVDEPFEAARWWANSHDALAVSREIFGLMNVWAGLPVRSGRP